TTVPEEKLDAAAAHRASQQRWTWLVFSIVGGSLAALMVTSLVIYVLSKEQEQQTARSEPRVETHETEKPPETEPPKDNGEAPKNADDGKGKIELPSSAPKVEGPPNSDPLAKPNTD